jgi:sigma-E factor negative regulatory protein RseA
LNEDGLAKMDTLKKTHENISALADGELAAGDVELAFASLDGGDGQAAWNLYYRIGDVLRADQSGSELSSTFSSRLSLRLKAEPALGRRAARAAPPSRATRAEPAERGLASR